MAGAAIDTADGKLLPDPGKKGVSFSYGRIMITAWYRRAAGCASPDLFLNHSGHYMRSNIIDLVVTLFCAAVSVAHGKEKYYVSFDLSHDGKIIDRSNDYATGRCGEGLAIGAYQR